MNEQDFEVTKTALLKILQESQSDTAKIRAAELLLALQERRDNARWIP